MKLKGKLFLNFGVVLVLSLAILGAIILYSFTENIQTSGEENIRLKTAVLVGKAETALHKPLEEVSTAVFSCLSRHPQATSCSTTFTAELEKAVSANPYIDAISLYSFPALQIQTLMGVSPDRRLTPLIRSYLAKRYREPRLFAVAERMYLVQRRDFGLYGQNVLVAECNRKKMEQLFDTLLNIEQSILILVDRQGQRILGIDHLLGRSLSSISSEELLAGDNQTQGMPTIHGYIYRYEKGFFGNQLFVVVDNSFFLKSLRILKSRIIAGILIVTWMLVWVILIVAHKIVSPIKKLSELTHEIADLNYSTELRPQSNDEIGELTRNFETMRQKIKGLIAKDPLTQVYNRRFLLHVFELAVRKAVRRQQELSCIMLDLDFFKRVNDTYGHQGGDAVLVALGKLLLETTRNYETPARFGGEEFVLVLPDTDADCAFTIAERIRKKVESLQVFLNGTRIPCTVSLGVASLIHNGSDSVDTIIHRADQALYQAKAQGRNRTVIHDGVAENETEDVK